MIFYNIFGMVLIFIWNASVLLGTIYLITEKDWSPWTLVATLFFILRWKPEWTPKKPKEPEPSRIIRDFIQ